MPPVLYDTSIYVTALRKGNEGLLSVRRLDSGSVVWLSAVVLEELYAGASDRGQKVVDFQREYTFDKPAVIQLGNRKFVRVVSK